ncbi:MAG: helix-turn-helix transcriptional regulator [Gammaproteobacteria bacterium]
MKHTSESIGAFIRKTRKTQGLTQQDLALTCGTGLRFIIDLEKGKPSCQFAKTLIVLQTLGIDIQLTPPLMNEQDKA